MWSSLLVLALLAALNPVRISLALLVITRPRPLQNLLAYWVGLLIVSVPALLVPLMVMHFTPMFSSLRLLQNRVLRQPISGRVEIMSCGEVVSAGAA